MNLWRGLTTCSHCAKNDPAGRLGSRGGWRGLCDHCLWALNQHRTHGDWPDVNHLFQYRAEVRDVIVKTKSRGGHPEFTGCVRVFLDEPRAHAAAAWCDGVAAAPASFWSRIRGRPHLATELAIELAAQHRKPVIRIIPPVLWRLRKQSMRSSGQRNADQETAFKVTVPANLTKTRFTGSSIRVLLIDDVRTSGVTLGVLAGTLSAQIANAEIRSLVFAAK